LRARLGGNKASHRRETIPLYLAGNAKLKKTGEKADRSRPDFDTSYSHDGLILLKHQ
jgi:hypothetical protein